MSDLKNEYISIKDYQGNKVICTTQRWSNHIIANHEIMKNNKKAVEETVSSPDSVYNSANYPTRKVFFKQSASATYGSTLTTKVIVEYDDSTNEGEIVTAFPAKGERGGISNAVFKK